jgi:hypothetical protein
MILPISVSSVGRIIGMSYWLLAKPKTLKLQEKRIDKTLEEKKGTVNAFLSRMLTAQKIRTRIDKWDCILFKSFCTAKETTIRIKRQFTDCEKILTRYLLEKGLISRIYKELKKLNTKRTKDPINKWAHELNR